MTSKSDERFVLVLQGGGALGAYQAGVFEGLDAGGFCPSWVAGISIGAINSAIMAGNPPGRRVERLREFWDTATSSLQIPGLVVTDSMKPWVTEFSAGWIAAFGAPGFFSPRFPPPLLQPRGTPEAISFYDTGPLRRTLERLVDFDLINSDGGVRLSLGATNVVTGNFCYFDSAHQRIGPEHVMASGALPPGFPPVEIEGELYWDGGLVSNTPMQYVLDQEVLDREDRRDYLVFQVDVFCARGAPPRTLLEAAEREKDIRFSSRTRMNTDLSLSLHRAKALVRELIAAASPEWRRDPRVQELECLTWDRAVTVVHLIFRPRHYHSNTKDYEFSRATMLDRWQAGVDDVRRSLEHRAWVRRRRPEHGVAVFDLGHGSAEIARETPRDYSSGEERAPQGRSRRPSRAAE